ncbi:MAG: fatty acid desaturase CarF family protein [Candidatus Melainabacteria bacterium]
MKLYTYGNPEWPILGEHIVIPNLNHHLNPRDFLKSTYWSRAKISYFISIVFILLFSAFKCLNWQIVFFVFFSSQANEFHAITHRTQRENGIFITSMQKIGFLQSKKQHGLHHTFPHDQNFCVITSFMNLALKRIHFWRILEKSFSFIGINPLRGSRIRKYV